MKKSCIRLLSLMLCLMTLVSLLPLSAAAATISGTPKSLTWNTVYSTDGYSYTQYGTVAWKATKPVVKNGVTWYEVKLYRNDKLVDTHIVGWDNVKENNYYSFDYSYAIESSGTYHFTVCGISDPNKGEPTRGKAVTSKDWKYTKPDSKAKKPTNLQWNDSLTMSWTRPSEYQYARYMLEMYYSESKPSSISDMDVLYRTWGLWQETFEPYWIPGTGYYCVRLRTISENIKENHHSSWVTSDIQYYKIGKPKVKVTESSGKPKISWDAVDFAVKYQVYRATSKDGEYERVKTTTGKSYTDSDVKAGKTYYYKVRAVLENNAKSSFSSPVSFTKKLSTPKVTAANTASSGKVKLTWKEISGAKSYTIFRATSEDGEYKELASTTSTSYTDSKGKVGTTYYYKVQANGSKSSANSSKSSAVPESRNLARPDVSITLTKKGQPKLSWKKISGASKYRIYRASSKDGEFKNLDDTTGTSFTDKTVKSGKTYYYKVKAIKSGANSASSSAVKIKTT